MKIAAIIPARGGSKGIPHKNIAPLAGRPLLAYTLELALTQREALCGIFVSTDSEHIAAVAKGFAGIQIIPRPEALAGDTANTETALLHALDWMKAQRNLEPEALLTLQVTSPLRSPETLAGFLQQFQELHDKGECNAMLSLHESREDLWERRNEGYRRLFPEWPRRRQSRPALFVENGAYYAVTAAALKASSSILGTNCAGFALPPEEGVDINTPLDLAFAEALLLQRKFAAPPRR